MTRRDRESLRRTFGVAAETYDAARPRYPEPLLDAVVAAAGLGPASRVLEVGCGTGQATVPLARRGIDVTAVELSEQLAAVARRRLRGLPARVETAEFETWPGDLPPFDAVLCATAWHWVDPAVRYRRAHEVLRSDGHLAVWSAGHVLPDGGDPFFREIQEVYDEVGEGLGPGADLPRPGELPSVAGEMAESGAFRVVLEEQIDWEVPYDTEGYLALLDTFSGHVAMAPDARRHLYAEIRRRIGLRPEGAVRRHWGAALVVGRRRDRGGPGVGG